MIVVAKRQEPIKNIYLFHDPGSLFALLRSHRCGQHIAEKSAAGQTFRALCSRQESNLHHILRKDASYPLNDGSLERSLA